MTKIKVTMSTNSLASRPAAVAELLGLPSSAVRHNGGKVVLVTTNDVAAVEAKLDAAYQVSAYEVV